ncbi:ABC transporter permease [Fibrella forsythiae]|uniref:ABC transporter permease n=1 Tax=Fibrella forsythiae TaxID=2817061 RepID=A0ABS3JE23_9BACT|nr:ABC transporter permease [Fibrella forsythiae]MBO0948252.1 ABC transporter permease [Fibrella forsythiae]
MFRNYLLVSFRTLWRNRTQSLINVVGLALGMACALLIGINIADELGFDRFHTKGPQLFKAYNRNTFEGSVHCWQSTPSPLAPALKAEFPEIVESTRFLWKQPFLTTSGTTRINLDGSFADPGFLTMFSFPLLQGNPKTALNGTNSVVLTQSAATKLFGAADPMGKVVRIDNKASFVVSGVMKNLPENTEFEFEMLMPWAYQTKNGDDYGYWGNNYVRTFVELAPTANLAAVNAKVSDITKRNSKGTEDNEVFLYPSAKWHLHGRFENGVESGGAITYVRMAGYIAGFILLLACINFMNLSTARSEKRGREVGIRKVVGAGRWSLVRQFLGESLLLTTLSFLLALLFTQLALPALNKLLEKQLSVPYADVRFWLACLMLILVTGTLAGSYPAFFLSAMEPIRVLKGKLMAVRGRLAPRQVLVVFQFLITVVLLICTLVVKRQLSHTQERDMGYSRTNLVFSRFSGDIDKNYNLIRNELLTQGVATAVCKTNNPITESYSNTWGLDWKGKPPGSKITFDQMTSGSGDFVKTMGVKLLAGRDLNHQTYPSDTSACLVNATAAKILGFKDPVGQIIKNDGTDFRIVGVFADFIWGSPFDKVPPMFVKGQNWSGAINYRLNPAVPTETALKKAAQIFTQYNPAFPFEVTFVDQEYQRKFDQIRPIGAMADVFAVLAVIIACLGLFGLATFMAEQRTKEIGVRKVLGASVPSVVALLSKDFLKLVVVAILLAVPLAWWGMNEWLSTYSYRVVLDGWIFLSAGLLAIVVALFTVSYQSFRAALTDPVDALRGE